MPETEMKLENALALVRNVPEISNVSMHNNPAFLLGSKVVDELPWVVFFGVYENMISSPWSYVSTDEAANEIVRACNEIIWDRAHTTEEIAQIHKDLITN